jgi:hypothetical protein
VVASDEVAQGVSLGEMLEGLLGVSCQERFSSCAH